MILAKDPATDMVHRLTLELNTLYVFIVNYYQLMQDHRHDIQVIQIN